MLYPAELPEHNYHSIVPKNSSGVNKKSQWISIKFRFIFHLLMHILWRVICVKGVKGMWETNDPYADLEDLIFDKDSGGPSER